MSESEKIFDEFFEKFFRDSTKKNRKLRRNKFGFSVNVLNIFNKNKGERKNEK